jgi:diguanylate cyclase (GGDEF)-like protein/putative nucleotidyltransferase with HDIG domain
VIEERTVEVPRKSRLFDQQTTLDNLTGLRGQRALWQELNRRSDSCSPSHPLAVLMFDFDLVREMNESYGRPVGDAVLRRGATVLRSLSTAPRLVFRLGGTEFVLLAELAADEATELAEQICAEVAAQNGALPSITVSCGVATLERPVEPWIALDRADAAKRDAKRFGGNRVAVAGGTSPTERVLLVEELEQETARRAALALAVATLEVRDRGTAEHSEDVLTLCEAVGHRLGFEGVELERLVAGAQLHDVGKVAIPSSILDKPAALSEAEWAVIREHTVIGEQILRSVPEMADVATIVRHSHEHWDGSGYPDGLSGQEIPLPSRVILCADAFHAMRCDRPYRHGRPASEAIAEIEACAGTQFDPAVVKAFVAVAADARRGAVTVTGGFRKRRLVVLLTALVIGGGSAVASIPEVRDAIQSVFATSTPPSHASTQTLTPQDFGFGPLGDLLVLPSPAHHKKHSPARHAKGSKPVADDGKRRRSGDRRGGFSSPDGGSQPGHDEVHGTTPPPPSDTAPAGDSPAPQAPDATTEANGHGRALGRDVPTPRQPAQSPGHTGGGRTDPPALGHQNPPPGQAKGHSK